jgi:pimeloyl-ACP methyl ester carboxylesterase
MRIEVRGVAIEVEDTGTGRPLLLLMGLGMHLGAWPPEFVEALVARGFRVIRIDNRDSGRSDRFDHLGTPNLFAAGLRYLLHLPVRAPYRLSDMAADAFGVLDALGIGAAEVCGVSMGGMIAQHMAAASPARVSRLTLMMTSSGARSLPQPPARVRRVLLAPPADPNDPEAVVARLERLFDVIGSPDFRVDRDQRRERLRALVQRGLHPKGSARQLVAVVADGDRSHLLGRISAPTHVMHGAADPLVPVAAAYDLQRKIAGSRLEVIEGWGHDLPPALMPRLATALDTPA